MWPSGLKKATPVCLILMSSCESHPPCRCSWGLADHSLSDRSPPSNSLLTRSFKWRTLVTWWLSGSHHFLLICQIWHYKYTYYMKRHNSSTVLYTVGKTGCTAAIGLDEMLQNGYEYGFKIKLVFNNWTWTSVFNWVIQIQNSTCLRLLLMLVFLCQLVPFAQLL